MFNLKKLDIDGCYLLSPRKFNDDRGSFIKIFHEDFFREHNLRTDFKEEYFSISKKNVFRGLHFQYPPMDHAKLVTCLKGGLKDIIVDLRTKSKTYKQVCCVELNEYNRDVLYLPSGVAHGFVVTSECDAVMLYNVTSVFSQEHDGGVHFEHVKEYLPCVENLIISDKDRNLPNIDCVKCF